MQTGDFSDLIHSHSFGNDNRVAERRTRAVMWITLCAMAVEIVAGWMFNSMALLADGWHMSSHALAIGMSAFAYGAARRYAQDSRFAFGTWKIEILSGFTGAIFLLMIAGLMVFSSVERFFSPSPIHYKQAIVVALLGLVVNIVCAFILGRDDHHHDHGHEHGTRHHHDLNLKSAYLHVIADAATSVFAIVALVGGWFYGWAWLDPLMGIIGAILIALWSRGLIVETAKVLLDREMDHPIVNDVRHSLETAPELQKSRVTDLHIWRVSKQAYAYALSLVTSDPMLKPAQVRAVLKTHSELVHGTIEIEYRA